MVRHMPLDEWDRKVAPVLNTLQTHSQWIKVDSAYIIQLVNRLSAIPEFETKALAAMQDAKSLLVEALCAVEKAIVDYQAKEKVT